MSQTKHLQCSLNKQNKDSYDIQLLTPFQ